MWPTGIADKRSCTGIAHDGCSVHFPVIKSTICSRELLAAAEDIAGIWILEKTTPLLIALHVVLKAEQEDFDSHHQNQTNLC